MCPVSRLYFIAGNLSFLNRSSYLKCLSLSDASTKEATQIDFFVFFQRLPISVVVLN